MAPLNKLMLLLLVVVADAHISLDPNYGAASGGYFTTDMKIPHGESGMHTTRMVVHVPRGISSARPEKPAGWNVTVVDYELAPEDRYVSHGREVTTAPDQIIFQAETPADALYTDHLMVITLSLKIGCSFNDAVDPTTYTGSNSIWERQHTLWFRTEQHSSYDNTLEISKSSMWTGALADDDDGNTPAWNPPSNTGLKACPYIFIYPGTRCTADHAGASVVGGMTWMGNYMDPVPNQAEVKHEQHVIALAEEAALSAQEGLDEVYAQGAEVEKAHAANDALAIRLDNLEDDKKTLLALSLTAVALSAALAGLLLGLCIFRVAAKEKFAHTIAAVPLMSTLAVDKSPNTVGVKAEAV